MLPDLNFEVNCAIPELQKWAVDWSQARCLYDFVLKLIFTFTVATSVLAEVSLYLISCGNPAMS